MLAIVRNKSRDVGMLMRASLGGAVRGFADVPQGHKDATLTGAAQNISNMRRRDITLRQDLKLAAARSWDEGVSSGFAADSLASLMHGKKIVLFGVPGAFTGVCSQSHVPGYVKLADDFKKKGVDDIVCVSVNDPFTMKAWAEKMGVDSSKVSFFADVDGSWTRSLGLEKDLSVALLGQRSQRYSMLVENGIIIKMMVEESPAELKVTDAETMLASMASL